MSKQRKRSAPRALLPACLVLQLVSCASSPTGRTQLILEPTDTAIIESEIAYRNAVRDLSDYGLLVKDSAINSRVARISGRIVSISVENFPHSARWEWSVGVVDDHETVNALCFAGGKILVFMGLFTQLKLTDDEFAHLIGHEISHALANHATERKSLSMVSTALLLAGGAVDIALGATGLISELEQTTTNLLLTLPYSREQERESDLLGTLLATQAGYDPGAALTLWQKIEDLSDDHTPAFFSTHPSPLERQAELRRVISNMAEVNIERQKATIWPVKIVR